MQWKILDGEIIFEESTRNIKWIFTCSLERKNSALNQWKTNKMDIIKKEEYSENQKRCRIKNSMTKKFNNIWNTKLRKSLKKQRKRIGAEKKKIRLVQELRFQTSKVPEIEGKRSQ